MQKAIRHFLGVSILMLLSGTVVAQELHDNNQDLIIRQPTLTYSDILNLKPERLDVTEQELEISYNPKDFEGISDTSGTKQQLLAKLRVEMKVEPDNSVVKIPQAPATEEQMEKLELLSETELQSFLGKKFKFLERMSKVLIFFRLKANIVNKVLNEVNNKFYNSSRLIAKSNAVGGTVMFSVSGGLALPKKIIEKLENRPVGKFIPKSGGFVYLLGLGVGITRHVQPSGRGNWVLDVFIDVERLNTTITGIAELSAAGTYGVVYELREGSFKSQITDTTYGGVSGVFRQGENQFGWAASTGLSFPPGIGALLVFSNKTTRHYILSLNFSKFKENHLNSTKATIQSWLEKTGLRKSPTHLCSGVFN